MLREKKGTHSQGNILGIKDIIFSISFLVHAVVRQNIKISTLYMCVSCSPIVGAVFSFVLEPERLVAERCTKHTTLRHFVEYGLRPCSLPYLLTAISK